MTHLESSIKKYSEEDSEYETTLEIVISLATRAKEIFESSEVAEKRMFVRLLLQNPTLDGKKPLFHLQSPFHLVAKLSKSENWQSTLDEFRTLDWKEIKIKFETSGLLAFWRQKAQWSVLLNQ